MKNNYAIVPEPNTVRLERLLPGPIERIWQYLTDPAKRRTWFADGPMELRVGGPVELIFDHRNISNEPLPERYQAMEEGTIKSTGVITECVPPTRLSYTWWENEGDHSEVTFDLDPQADGILLVITHRRLANREDMLGVSGGWHSHVDILEDILNDRSPRPFWANHAKLKEAYESIIPAHN